VGRESSAVAGAKSPSETVWAIVEAFGEGRKGLGEAKRVLPGSGKETTVG